MARSDDAQHDLDDLGALIRLHRKNAQVTGAEAAARAGFTQSKLSKIENGVLLPSADDVRRLATGLGMDPAATGQALELIRRLHADQAAQRIALRRGPITEHAALVAKFGPAGHIVAADTAVLSDWLRTHDYLISAAGPLTARNAKAAATLLRKRKRLLERPAITFECFVFESALRTRVGSLRVMADQVQDVAAASERLPNVTVRVITSEAFVTPPLAHGFEMHNDRRVVLTMIPGVVVLTSEDDVQPFRQVVASMRSCALSRDRSCGYLHRLGGLYDFLARMDQVTPVAQVGAKAHLGNT